MMARNDMRRKVLARMVKTIWKREPSKTSVLLPYSLESVGHQEAELYWCRDMSVLFSGKTVPKESADRMLIPGLRAGCTRPPHPCCRA